MHAKIHHSNTYSLYCKWSFRKQKKGNEGNLQSPVTALPENRWLESKTDTQTHPHTTRASENGGEEHGLTIAVGRKMFPRGWKRGHSATNQTKKSLIAPKAWLSGSWKERRRISQSGLRTSAASKALKLLGPPDEAERGEVSKYFGLHAS